MTLAADSRVVLATRARSFRWAAAFLPEGSHDEAAILYAFCLEVDDAADESGSREEAERALAVIEGGLAGEPANPVVTAVRERIDGKAIRGYAVRDLIAGARSDLDQVQVADDGELIRYAYRVAGTVGLMMCPVIDVQDPEAFPHAIDLGIAMQLTNICRDVLEDAQMGRVYLPATRLLAAGTSPEAIVDGTVDREAVATVVCDVLALAETHYRSGEAGLRFIPWRPRLAIAIASRLYRAIGLRLARSGGDSLRGRTVVPWWEKLMWVVVAIISWPLPKTGGASDDARRYART